jgi:molybdenum cofactor cytidylyltransferase
MPGDHAPVAGMILAAGTSTRLGRPKQLLPLGGQPLIWQTVNRALEAGLDELSVVIGNEADAMREALAGLPVRIVENAAYISGQASSLCAGVAALDDEIGAAVMLLGDQPELDPAAIDNVIATWRETGAPVVLTAYRNRQAHPILLDRALFPELLEIEGDQGARDVIRRYQDRVATAPFDADAPADIDTEDAYQHLLARWNG